jgi:myxalamid-type polyketide synthase MxaB
MLETLGGLYAEGAEVDWEGFDRPYARRRVPLPTYPFQRQRYWIETSPGSNTSVSHRRQLVGDHPLLGERLWLAGSQSGKMRFQSEITAQTLAALPDRRHLDNHSLSDVVYIEIALAAAKQVLQTSQPGTRKVKIHHPLPCDVDLMIQTVVTPREDQSLGFEIYSNSLDGAEGAVLHASGRLTTVADPFPLSPDAVRGWRECDENNVHSTNPSCITRLLQYDDHIVARIECPPEWMLDTEQYVIPPMLLDACLLSAAKLTGDNAGGKFLPVTIGEVNLHRPLPRRFWCEARRVGDTQAGALLVNMRLCSDDGDPVAEIRDLALELPCARRQSTEQAQTLADWLYEVTWQPQSLAETTKQLTGPWLIMADRSGIGLALARSLASQGADSTVVYRGNAPSSNDIKITSADSVGGLSKLIAQLPAGDGEYRIVYLWGLDEHPASDDPLGSGVRAVGGVTQLIQALESPGAPQARGLWLVTRLSQGVTDDFIEPGQRPLWSLGGAIVNEHPALNCRRVDIGSECGIEGTARHLATELTQDGAEYQVAYRDEKRYVARLSRKSVHAAHGFPTGPFRVGISEYGTLENLQLVSIPRRCPGPGEAEVKVRAAGLNFKETVFALGMMPEYVPEDASEMSFGLEFSGVVGAVGAGVTHVAPGDEVVGIGPGSMSSHLVINAKNVVRKPRRLSFVEAAGVPTVFMTCHYGLNRLAGLASGNSILVHACAGGVGQAALQLAQRAGAVIYGTASPPKWEHLKDQGVRHVMNSRTLDFTEEIMRLTSGRGVDVVLNSFSGDFIPRSLDVVAANGCFIELGQRGVWTAEQVKEYRPDIHYYNFDLGRVLENEPGLYADLLGELNILFDNGELEQPITRVFPVSEVTDAFRYLAQGKNVGKVVIAMPKADVEDADSQAHLIKPDRRYLVTGGFGELGLVVAQWLVEHGARHLVLMGRREPAAQTRAVIAELESKGTRVQACCVDVSRQAELAQVFEELRGDDIPLGGVIHAAGNAGYGMLLSHDEHSLAQAMAPKIAGAWHLHSLTQDQPLDFFVCFSSIASVDFAASGQGAYAAANAYMDALMQSRWSHGQVGLSIGWSAWAETGMIARAGTGAKARVTQSGIGLIPTHDALDALNLLLYDPAVAHGIVLPVEWSILMQTLPGTDQAFFDAFRQLSYAGQSGSTRFVEALNLLPAHERRPHLADHIRTHIARVLGMSSPEAIGLQDKLFELGLDSLLAVELKNRLQASLGCVLLPTLMFDRPTVQALTDYLADSVLKLPTEVAAQPGRAARKDPLLANVEALSEQEAEALLQQELENY